MTTPTMKEILRVTASDREDAMTAPTPGLCNFVKCITDDGQELPMMRCPNCQKPRMVGYRCDGCDLAAAQEALKNHLHLDNHNAIVRQLEERAQRAEALAESYRKALDNIETGLRKAGASLPAPEITGTIEGSMNTGMCIALCLVVTEREAIAEGK